MMLILAGNARAYSVFVSDLTSTNSSLRVGENGSIKQVLIVLSRKISQISLP